VFGSISKSISFEIPKVYLLKPSTSNRRYYVIPIHSRLYPNMSLPSEPISIPISKSEVEAGVISPRNLEIATRALRRDGLVVLEDLVPHHILDTLNVEMVKDAYELQSRKDSPFNYNKGNIQQDPLLTEELFSNEIYLSLFHLHSSVTTNHLTILDPIVTQVTSTTLGPNPSLRFISGNTALPPTPGSPPKSQPTHNDADFDHPNIPFALVINVCLIDMAPENGSTEIWLGTHADTTIEDQEGAHGDRASGRIKAELLKKRKEERPPIQPVVKKGSVIVRDLRLWHGGMPNLSEDPRVMLAMSMFFFPFPKPSLLTLSSPLCTLVSQPDDCRIRSRAERKAHS
jgi:ectoine hydroxylase-related dioxygenase (phytanoyl-CoA dioxygenase family)